MIDRPIETGGEMLFGGDVSREEMDSWLATDRQMENLSAATASLQEELKQADKERADVIDALARLKTMRRARDRRCALLSKRIQKLRHQITSRRWEIYQGLKTMNWAKRVGDEKNA